METIEIMVHEPVQKQKAGKHYTSDTRIVSAALSVGGEYRATGYVETLSSESKSGKEYNRFGIYVNGKYVTARGHYEKAVGKLITAMYSEGGRHV